ncbi:glycosyltransferase family 2 protein [Salinimonas chungwhensis]|uniref:glycosyltransferase family 2 protein n=1 Tax=Salinimonas chungwhensis TaxID=265425 RepID=UPI00037E7780|nr:glycosyltransferase family A protein [Salinimonas chungwhensis]
MNPATLPEYPLVSVIIPTYNGADSIHRAINSVLAQQWGNVEILVVDDNGQDSNAQQDTQNVINDIADDRILYIPHELNSNGAVARNTGIEAARGEFVGFLDDDDVYLPERLSRSVEFLSEHPECIGMCTAVDVHYSATHTTIVPMKKPVTSSRLLTDEMCIGTGSNLFFRRVLFDEGFRFDTAFKRHQDLEFLLRVLREYRVGNLDEILIVKKTNANSNIPDYENFRAAKKMYLQTFSPEIKALPGGDRYQFYKNHYRLLLDIAEIEGKKSNIIKAYIDCLTHGVFYAGDVISLILGRQNYLNIKNKFNRG